MNFFVRYYENVDHLSVDDASTKLLCSYFESLNNVMISIKSLLNKSNTNQTGVNVMRQNVADLQRFLKTGNFAVIKIELSS